MEKLAHHTRSISFLLRERRKGVGEVATGAERRTRERREKGDEGRRASGEGGPRGEATVVKVLMCSNERRNGGGGGVAKLLGGNTDSKTARWLRGLS